LWDYFLEANPFRFFVPSPPALKGVLVRSKFVGVDIDGDDENEY